MKDPDYVASVHPLRVMEHSFFGVVSSPRDAYIVLEAARLNILPRVTRRLTDLERARLVRPGAVFVYDETESGIRRWTDQKRWSPSRVSGAFLIYSEQPNESNGFKSTLFKQSFSTNTIMGNKLHLVAYYDRDSLVSGHLPAVHHDPRLQNVTIPAGLYPDQRAITFTNDITTISPNLGPLQMQARITQPQRPSTSGTNYDDNDQPPSASHRDPLHPTTYLPPASSSRPPSPSATFSSQSQSQASQPYARPSQPHHIYSSSEPASISDRWRMQSQLGSYATHTATTGDFEDRQRSEPLPNVASQFSPISPTIYTSASASSPASSRGSGSGSLLTKSSGGRQHMLPPLQSIFPDSALRELSLQRTVSEHTTHSAPSLMSRYPPLPASSSPSLSGNHGRSSEDKRQIDLLSRFLQL